MLAAYHYIPKPGSLDMKAGQKYALILFSNAEFDALELANADVFATQGDLFFD